MVSHERTRRIGDRIREEIAVLLLRDVADPRLQMVTVTAVEVDRELAFATIYVTATGSEDRADEVLAALKGAQGFLRRELAGRIQLRNFPKLRFYWDASQVRGARVEELLAMLDSDEESGERESSEE